MSCAGNKILKTALAGWQTNGITTVQSGLPFSVTISADQANVGQGTQRANFSGTAPVADCGSGKLTQCVNLAAFTLPALYTYGNTPRNFLRGPGLVNFDWSLFKNFTVTERFKLQFRWETFNTTNHSNLNLPSVTLDKANAGSITKAKAARVMQFGMRYEF